MPLFSVVVREHAYTGRFYSDVVQAGSFEEALQAAAQHAAVPWPPPGPVPQGEFDVAVTARTGTERLDTGIAHAERPGEAPPLAAERPGEAPQPAAERRGEAPQPAAERRGEAPQPAAERRGEAPQPAAERREEAPEPAAEQVAVPQPAAERPGEAPELAAERREEAAQPAPGPPPQRGFSVAVREQAHTNRVYTEVVQAGSSEEALLVAAELAAAPQPSPGPEPWADAAGRQVCRCLDLLPAALRAGGGTRSSAHGGRARLRTSGEVGAGRPRRRAYPARSGHRRSRGFLDHAAIARPGGGVPVGCAASNPWPAQAAPSLAFPVAVC